MTSTANPHFLSEMDATPTNQLRDDLDFPHSGIFKALHLASRGTYALKDTGVDFDITQSNNSGFTRLAVKGGKAYRDGALVTLGSGVGTTTNIDCTATYNPGGGAVDVTPSTSGDVYLFLVGNSSNALVLRGSNAATNAVPELVEGDVPIAVVKVVANSADSASDRPIQYLTTSKVTNTVSVGYDSSGYTEAGSLTGSASGIKIDAALEVEQGASGGQTAFIIDNNDTDKVAMSIEAANIDADVMDISADAVTTANVIDITADALTTGKILNIISNSSSTSTRRLVNITNDNTAATATTPLYIKNDSTGDTIILESTNGDATAMPVMVFNRNSGSPATNDYLGSIEFKGEDSAGSSNTYAAMSSRIVDVDNNQESGALFLQLLHDGGLSSFLYAKGGVDSTSGGSDDSTGAGAIIFNFNSHNIDLQVKGLTMAHLIYADASQDKVGIGINTPKNILQVNHTGADGNDGIQIIRDDATTADGDLLGGIGFDSDDGNVPSSITEASAFIASYATQNHTSTEKGGNLKFGVSLIDDNDDTASTVVANVGQPDTISASAGADPTTHAGLNSRVTTVVLGNGTYAPTLTDSGIVVVFTHANSTLTLPSIASGVADRDKIGVQFTVFNETGSDIDDQVNVSGSATYNGTAEGSTTLDNIASYKAKTFVCTGTDKWIVIG